MPVLSWFWAIAYVAPPGTELGTCDAPTPSSARTSVSHG